MSTKQKWGRCFLHLTNGWTVSISDGDTPPAICSVAAWPSANDDETVTEDLEDWFTFSEDRKEVRCWNVNDIRDALAEVEAAEPPK